MRKHHLIRRKLNLRCGQGSEYASDLFVILQILMTKKFWKSYQFFTFPLTVSYNNLRVNRIIVTGRCSILKQSPGGVLKNEACKFIKKETLGQVLSCEFCGISRKPPVAASIYKKVFWKNLPNFLENIYVEVSFIISCNFCS